MKAYIAKKSRILKVFLMAVTLGGLFFAFGSIKADVPSEYIANYAIANDRDTILGLLVEIDAASKIGDQVPQSKFVELNASFQTVLPKFPQEYTFKVVYQQCLTLSQDLTTYTSLDYQDKMGSFIANCYKPFSDILKKISSKYTVVASAKASPQSGPAPLVVTLDARASVDPSNDTIPSKNFYRYYRDTDGEDKTIGVGPVVTATFAEAGNYLIHLTVRSSNADTQGIFDGEKTLSVDVTPKTATITVYANSQKLTKDTKAKISIQEAQNGVLLDGTATIPMGGRQILSHNRNISSREGFSFTKDGDGTPGILRVVLPGQGEYKLVLTTSDNEDNKVQETYYLVVSDPVAIIRQRPENGTTSTTFSFDSAASYSIISVLTLYTREVFDQNGDKIETYQGQSIKQNFKEPGAYTIKLTVQDQLGQTNTDSLQIFVESSDPIPQFTIRPTNTWKDPSEFIFDASVSSDIDKTNGYDNLSYEWFLGDTSKAKLVATENNNEVIKVQFDALGKHTIRLVAKDDFGKLAEIEKEIDINSILRPEIIAVPLATSRGNPINFVVKSNEPIVNYVWDFGDGDTRTVQSDKITHTYKKSGVYKVVLKVSGAEGMTNEMSKTVFVGEKDFPIGGYIVMDKASNILIQNETCTQNVAGNELVFPAYQIDRYQDIVIDPSSSVNTKGQKTNLQFYFQPRGGEIYKTQMLTYKFNELGCSYIDMTVEDTSISKDDKVRIRFKVVNSLPVLDNVILTFPQYGNEVGVGFKENNVKDIFNDTFDPLIVKVSATNAEDPDGFISYFKRYYAYKDDPTRYLETKITPGNIPYAFFSLPRIPGEFIFGVIMYDNDDGKQSNEEIIGNGPLVFFPPDVTRPDIPLVTLRSSQSTVEIGDEVQFDVVSKIISDRPDFIQERTIQYDFDGDGERDLTTKSDRVTHVYTKPSEFGYKPRASVIYRGYRGVGVGGTIVVRNGLKPMLLSDSFDKFAIFRDVSIGDIANKSICLNLQDCSEEGGHVVTTGIAFPATYPEYGKYYISLDVTDKNANMASKKRALTLTTGVKTQDFHILSIPKASVSTEGTEFFVGKNLANSILFYVLYDFSQGSCFVDADLAVDSDGDGNKEGDKDFSCNELHMQVYTPKYQTTKGRIYFTNASNQLVSTDFTVSFLDYQVELDADTQALYQQLDELYSSLPVDATGSISNFKTLLLQLRDGLLDPVATKSNLVAVKDYRDNNPVILDDHQATLLNAVFTRLADKSVIAAQGGNEYETAKAEILSILPVNLAVDVNALFNDFESITSEGIDNSQQDQRKAALQNILNLIQRNTATPDAEVMANQLDPLDLDAVIVPNICKIMAFYGLVSELCPDTNIKIISEPVAAENVEGTSRWKILLRVVGIGAGIFLLLLIFFTIRARIRQGREEEEAVIPPATPTPAPIPTPPTPPAT